MDGCNEARPILHYILPSAWGDCRMVEIISKGQISEFCKLRFYTLFLFKALTETIEHRSDNVSWAGGGSRQTYHCLPKVETATIHRYVGTYYVGSKSSWHEWALCPPSRSESRMVRQMFFQLHVPPSSCGSSMNVQQRIWFCLLLCLMVVASSLCPLAGLRSNALTITIP